MKELVLKSIEETSAAGFSQAWLCSICGVSDDPRRPILLAVSDNGPRMKSDATKAFMVAMAVAQHHGRPHTPTDQAWIETLLGHVKVEWPPNPQGPGRSTARSHFAHP